MKIADPLERVTPLDATKLPHWDATTKIPPIGDRNAARRRIVVRQITGWFTFGVILGLTLMAVTL